MTKEQEHVADLAQCWPSVREREMTERKREREMTAREISGHQPVWPICCTDLCCLCSTYDVASQHVASSLFVTFVDLVSVVRLLVCSCLCVAVVPVFCAVFVGSAPSQSGAAGTSPRIHRPQPPSSLLMLDSCGTTGNRRKLHRPRLLCWLCMPGSSAFKSWWIPWRTAHLSPNV